MAEAKNDKAEAESSRESTLSELDELFEVGMMGWWDEGRPKNRDTSPTFEGIKIETEGIKSDVRRSADKKW